MLDRSDGSRHTIGTAARGARAGIIVALVGAVALGAASRARAAPAASHAKAAATATTANAGDGTIGYDNGFFVRSADGASSFQLNGLFQSRYTWFDPRQNVAPLGATPGGRNTFDVYLGRVAASGTLLDPKLHYFLQIQGSTAGNSNVPTMLDWFIARDISKYLTVQAGRFWTAYSYEYNDNPANYLFADLSTAEFAFALPRAIGVQVSGQMHRFGYAAMVSNGIPALDAPGQENPDGRLAYLGHVQVDLLAPYGAVETDPSPAGARKTALTLWFSAAANPVIGASQFENVQAGARTANATATAGFRRGFLSLQATGYFRRTTPAGGASSSDASGYGEQAGYYLVPGRLEVAERIAGVTWGSADYQPVTPSPATWFAGPTFSYRTVTEHSAGLNYYLHGHRAKLQVSYSYLSGAAWSGARYGASRIWVQEQLQF